MILVSFGVFYIIIVYCSIVDGNYYITSLTNDSDDVIALVDLSRNTNSLNSPQVLISTQLHHIVSTRIRHEGFVLLIGKNGFCFGILHTYSLYC